jgi:hypothetical protein
MNADLKPPRHVLSASQGIKLERQPTTLDAIPYYVHSVQFEASQLIYHQYFANIFRW